MGQIRVFKILSSFLAFIVHQKHSLVEKGPTHLDIYIQSSIYFK